MKALKAALKTLKALPKKILCYYIDLFKRSFQYIRQLVRAAVINAVIMIPLVYATRIIMDLVGLHEPKIIVPMENPFGGLPISMMAVVCLGIGLFEETYFRYLIMDCMMEKAMRMPKTLALVLSSLMFGAAHLANPGGWLVTLPQAVGAAGAGFWFAHIYKKHGLHFAILTHALYDFAIFSIALYIK